MKAWKRVEPTTVTKIGWRTIVSKTFIMPDGSTSEFQTYDTEGRSYVAAIALTPDNQIIIARQFRAGPEAIMNDLPGGGVESDEGLDTAMHRELLEETGYTAGHLEYMGAVCKDEKFNAKLHYYIAYDCTQTATQHLDTDEYVDVVLMSIDEALSMAQKGLTTETSAFLLAYERLKELQTQ